MNKKKQHKRRIKELERFVKVSDEKAYFWIHRCNTTQSELLILSESTEQLRQLADKPMYKGQLDTIRHNLAVIADQAQQMYIELSGVVSPTLPEEDLTYANR